MIQLLILVQLVSAFTLKWYIPVGPGWVGCRVLVCDTDRDNRPELILGYYDNYPRVVLYELGLDDTFRLECVIDTVTENVWDYGDFDLDGLYDIVMQYGNLDPFWIGITIFESPDSFSYPTQEVWRDTVGFALVTPICVYDIDQDGRPEIVKVLGDYTHLEIYESVGDNQYVNICSITTASTNNSSSTLAFGDFDTDGRNEFVWGYSAGEYSIFECIGDNLYQEITLQQLPSLNIKDCFTVPDADGDGKWEFVVKGYVIPSAEVHAFIFEATGNNTYEIIQTFTLPGGDYYGGYSEAGDVDGDSIPEIVLEARQNVFIIKASGNDSFYVWDTLPGNASGSSVRVTHDIDGNGLNEIVISGNHQTRIYEYVGPGIEEIAERFTPDAGRLEVYPNPFRDRTDIRCQIPDTRYKTTDKHISDITHLTSVSLKIYDATGRLVRQWDYQTMRQCDEIVWDGTDDSGRRLPAGVYFIHLESCDRKTPMKQKVVKLE